MCQVTPFTLPCCRRIYVSVERLPSCPDGWPKKKCPKELCVQISGFQAKDVDNRSTGICWRCLAWHKDMGPYARENLRPVLDRAFIVEGLGDFSVEDRRVKMVNIGICRHCGARGDCDNCGTGKEAGKGKDNALDGWDHKGKRKAPEADDMQARYKMAKVGHSGPSTLTFTSAFPTTSLTSMASSGYAAQPFQRRPIDTSPLQYHFNSTQIGDDEFHEAVPASSFHSQQTSFQSPMSRNPSGRWQDSQIFQSQSSSGTRDGRFPVDSLLEHSRKAEEPEHRFGHSFSAPQNQTVDQPPVPKFDTSWVVAEMNNMDDENFENLLHGCGDPVETQGFKNEIKSPATEVLEPPPSSLVDRSVGLPKNTYPSPS